MTTPLVHNTIPHSFHIFSDVRGFPRIHDNTSGVSVQIKAGDSLLINVPLRMLQGDELPISEGDNGVLLGMGYLWCTDKDTGGRAWNLALSLPVVQTYEEPSRRNSGWIRSPSAAGFYMRPSIVGAEWVPCYYDGAVWFALLNVAKRVPGGPLPVLSTDLKMVRSSGQMNVRWRPIEFADPYIVRPNL